MSSRKRSWLLLLAAVLTTSASLDARSEEVAQVPASLQNSPEYTQYAAILVQLDLLANPATAPLPIDVKAAEPGVLSIQGSVNNSRLRRFIIDNARRISGLKVDDAMQSGEVTRDYLVPVTADRMETETSATLAAFFPELAKEIRVTVTEEGVVVLNGSIPSYESKLAISQAVKSQPGCKAVVNLLMVSADSETGMVQVNDAGFQLRANQLPSIPAAPLIDLSNIDSDRPTVRALTGSPMGDDSPEVDLVTQQITEDVRAKIKRIPELSGIDVEVVVVDGEVTLSGKIERRDAIEAATRAAVDVAGVRKVVVKGAPFSMQKNVPTQKMNSEEAEKEPSESNKLFGFLPKLDFSKEKGPEALSGDRRFRENIRKTLKKRCGDRVDDLSIKNTLDGLVIEGEVKSPRDRTFVLKQIDNIVELRALNYQVVVRVKEE
ncbi:MAG: BON domain-containing protein [Planctomycetota bacterium]